MKHRNLILTAAILTGTLGLRAQITSAQTKPVGTNPLENRNSEKQFEQRNSSISGNQQDMTGMSADDINQAKEALRAKGLNPGPMNGSVDSQTRQALREFQQDNDLPATGNLDQQTAGKLGVTVGRDAGSVEPHGDRGPYSHGHSD
jgi:peptidoglycan hydrolase-like protein with peptidoglycan-binding domain